MDRHTPAKAVATAVEMAESAWLKAWELADEMDVTCPAAPGSQPLTPLAASGGERWGSVCALMGGPVRALTARRVCQTAGNGARVASLGCIGSLQPPASPTTIVPRMTGSMCQAVRAAAMELRHFTW